MFVNWTETKFNFERINELMASSSVAKTKVDCCYYKTTFAQNIIADHENTWQSCQFCTLQLLLQKCYILAGSASDCTISAEGSCWHFLSLQITFSINNGVIWNW